MLLIQRGATGIRLDGAAATLHAPLGVTGRPAPYTVSGSSAKRSASSSPLPRRSQGSCARSPPAVMRCSSVHVQWCSTVLRPRRPIFGRPGRCCCASMAVRRPRAKAVARFRRRVEGDFPQQLRIGQYSHALQTSESRPLRSCVAVTGESPLELLYLRLLIEAARSNEAQLRARNCASPTSRSAHHSRARACLEPGDERTRTQGGQSRSRFITIL